MMIYPGRTRDMSGMVVGDYLLLSFQGDQHRAPCQQGCTSSSIPFAALKGHSCACLQVYFPCWRDSRLLESVVDSGLLATKEGTAGVDHRLLLRLSGVGRASSIKEERHLSSREPNTVWSPSSGSTTWDWTDSSLSLLVWLTYSLITLLTLSLCSLARFSALQSLQLTSLIPSLCNLASLWSSVCICAQSMTLMGTHPLLSCFSVLFCLRSNTLFAWHDLFSLASL